MNKYFFTSEAVTEGHPDKICDLISDTILDEALKNDSNSKMAIETTIKDDLIFIYGEENTKAKLDYETIAKNVLKEIGYEEDFKVLTKISKQSLEITNAVEQKNVCAGDQGIMFGYATNETEEYMPIAITFANKLALKLAMERKNKEIIGILPDGKTQVTIEYQNGVPKRVDTIIIACQHKENIDKEYLRNSIIEKVIKKVIPEKMLDDKTNIYINTSGSFIKGGPFADSGTTGRKIVCDTYGGYCPIGGGALSSKDPTKVDRTGAYYARYVCKNIVAHGYCDKCLLQVSYAIGKEGPISLFIDTFETNKVSIEEIKKYIDNNFSFKVQNMIDELNLKRPIYKSVSCYGHFGRNDLDLSWEKIKN